jgi:hypothetical protein
MRVFEYVCYGGTGGERMTRRGTVVQLLLDIPYLIVGGLIPPLPVINDVLGKGERDAGMSGGCTWEPFLLSAVEFAEVAAYLSTRGGKRGEALRFEAYPAWVDTDSKWGIWLAHRVHSIVVDENLRRWHGIEQAIESGKGAAKQRGAGSRVPHFMRLSRLLQQWVGFVQRDKRET